MDITMCHTEKADWVCHFTRSYLASVKDGFVRVGLATGQLLE